MWSVAMFHEVFTGVFITYIYATQLEGRSER